MNVIVPAIKDSVVIEGVVRYSDGKPAAEVWVNFKAAKSDSNISGDVNEKTDSAGRFSMKVLKGLTGELAAEKWLLQGLFENCPEVDELLNKSGSNNTTSTTTVIEIQTAHDFFNLELTFPFPACKKAKE